MQALKNAVDLAVRGYLRHSYTDYDRQLSNLVVALNNDKIPEVLNREIKQEAMRKVDLILSAMESQSTPIYPDPGLTDY